MQRIATSTKAVDLYGVGKHGFKDGNLTVGITPTDLEASWCNGVQEELVNLIEVAGLVASGATLNQIVQAIAILQRQQTNTAFTTTGVAPNFVLTPSLPVTAYAANQRFRVNFNVAGSGANAINVSALGAKLLKQYDGSGAKVAAVIAAGQLADIEYDGVDFVILDPLPGASRQIQPVTASVAANALTCTLNPTSLDFRATPLPSGTVNTRTVAAISVVIPSGATLGSISAMQSRLVLLAIDNAGTVELAVVNIAGGNNLDETTLISTTAISAAATAANVIYSTTARASVPFRVVGYIESTQAVAGTWATAPSTIQGMGGQALAAMSSFGCGQSWKSHGVEITRAVGATYYNPTGKLIVVFVQVPNFDASSSFGYTITVTQNGITKTFQHYATPSIGAGNQMVSGYTPIPAGASYLVSGNSFNGWNELR